MTLTRVYHDPIHIDLEGQIRRFIEATARHPLVEHQLRNFQLSNPSTILTLLSNLLTVPSLTLAVVEFFRPLLLDLCARMLDDDAEPGAKLVALTLLIEPHEEIYPILSAFFRQPLLKQGPLALISEQSSTAELQKILLAYYRVLRSCPQLVPDLSWPVTKLSSLFSPRHKDNGVTLLATHCYALQTRLTDALTEKLQREIFGELAMADAEIQAGEMLDGNPLMLDGWLLVVSEVTRIVNMRSSLAKHQDYFTATRSVLEVAHLSPRVINVSGILLFRNPVQHVIPSNLVLTPTTITILRDLALHLSLKYPTLITSPASNGKSLLLFYLCGLIYPSNSNQIVTLSLADTSLDARSLLGSYVSSVTNPGTFEWKDGVLVSAMRGGKWLVLDDIDRASGEVLGVINSVVESLGIGKAIGARAYLDIPGRTRVIATEGFMVFATRSISPSHNDQYPSPSFLGAHKFSEVIVPSPTPEELRAIVNARFPRIAGTVAHSLIHSWECIKVIAPASHDVGLRELEKWCSRIADVLPQAPPVMDCDVDLNNPPLLLTIFSNPSLREEMYVEARDIFFGGGATTAAAKSYSQMAAKIMADHLGLSEDRATWAMNNRTPDLEVEKGSDGRVTAIRMGRTRLAARLAKVEMDPTPPRPFALHRPSLLLLSRLVTCISLSEPALLTGETGTGKTTAVSHLSQLLNRILISLNLSHQTESSDLLGGFKPIDTRIPAAALQQQFGDLFGRTFSRKKNPKFEEAVRQAISKCKWKRVVGLWCEAVKLAKDRIHSRDQLEAEADGKRGIESPRKRRRIEGSTDQLPDEWTAFERQVLDFNVLHVQGKGRLAFDFVEGPLVKAIRNGYWVLLDEINLASAETLESIAPLLERPTSSITLTEQGSLTPIPRHPDFRLFACMNPATDVGKKDLPPNIRSRFTEIFVPPPDSDRDALLAIVAQYIGHIALADKAAILDVAEFYIAIRRLSEERLIADGSNHRPHYSIRTLARALTFASDVAPSFGLRRALWEGCLMAFTMILDDKSSILVRPLAEKFILRGVKNIRSLITQIPSPPHGGPREDFIQVGPFWLSRGPLELEVVDEYILTPSVESKLLDLARLVLTRRFPVLIEGPTSSGKTSAIEYLARRTGHRFVRINNHEHTDLQEYLGTYVSDPDTGRLVFQDGILVRALRNGDWLVLDELNLAPTDVLEALNRLLDDNRELHIPETQEVVRPHPHFMLFATQNPPGLYAGRKVLSRAFRNRFLEVHFDDVPQDELETILHRRCQIPESYAKRIVAVFQELQRRRQAGRVFESKHGFATLRDLFRWAGRDAVGYQQLAENGYMLLAERTRRDDDKLVVKEIIESIMKVKIEQNGMYNLFQPGLDVLQKLGCALPNSPSITWTAAMQRLFALVASALRYNEPVLLVGETGSGKTSVCELYAGVVGAKLYTINCHQNTETSDLLGGQRPIRNRASSRAEAIQRTRLDFQKHFGIDIPSCDDLDAIIAAIDKQLSQQTLSSDAQNDLLTSRQVLQQASSLFEWQDGPLMLAMRSGDVLLLDEISLADDSVLERLNSVLEPSRTLVLAEKGGRDVDHVKILASSGFQLLATMNPGGDYGKKELSPALRNRFTEIWVPQVTHRADREAIVQTMWRHDDLISFTRPLLDFVNWVEVTLQAYSAFGLRDLLAWVHFSNEIYSPKDNVRSAALVFHHAAHMVFLDGLGSLPETAGYSKTSITNLKTQAIEKLTHLVPLTPADLSAQLDRTLVRTEAGFCIGSFGIPRGLETPLVSDFSLEAPTTRDNAMRILRACQVQKPILLEGSPGVGKTSLVTALANAAGHRLCRVNLSDQTDLMDLFGSDLPVEGGKAGEFIWKDAAFLRALQDGDWVLLDEMNLAPQAVLEGLNAVLDHRGVVYIPELGRSFTRHPRFRIFAAQNPLHQGGGRKGLPKSFLNRFTKVHVQELSPDDLLSICRRLFPGVATELLQRMIMFNTKLNEAVMVQRSFGRNGSPWEFNLRDILRWLHLLRAGSGLEIHRHPADYLDTIYLQRFRTEGDRHHATAIFAQLFDMNYLDIINKSPPHPFISSLYAQFGHTLITRNIHHHMSAHHNCHLQIHLRPLQSLAKCIELGWVVIITGASGAGKTSTVRLLAELFGHPLQEFSMNNAMDTMDLLGSFEQPDATARLQSLALDVLALADRSPLDPVAIVDVQTLRDALFSTTGRLSPPLVQRVLDIVPQSGERDKLNQALDIVVVPEVTTGKFDWVDGPLVRAMKYGHWLLLDNANLCNPSVLDRINSLCENDGTLALNERGFVGGEVQVLRPHPSFRLIMTVDPHNGELSRAMRNRGIEIFLPTAIEEEDRHRLYDLFRLIPAVCSVNTKSFHTLSLQSEVGRRGLLTCLREVKFTSALTIPLSNLAIIDARSASLAVHYESMSRTPTSVDTCAIFVCQSSKPAYMAFLRRAVQHLIPDGDYPLIVDLANAPLLRLVYLNARTTSDLHRLPPDFFLTQPLDLAMNPHLAELSIGPSSFPARSISLVIELFVRLRLIKQNQILPGEANEWNSMTVLQKSQHIAAKKAATGMVARGIQQVAPLLNSTLQALENIVNTPSNMLELQVTTLDTALALLGYTEHLCIMSRGSHFDFSASQILAQWFVLALREHSPVFSHVAENAQAFLEVVSPKSGHGMTRIWEDLLVPSLPLDSEPNVQRPSKELVEPGSNESTRWNTFQFMALSGTSYLFSHPNQVISKLASELKPVTIYLPSKPDGILDSNSPTLAILELEFLASLRSLEVQKILKLGNSFLCLAARTLQYPLNHLIYVQHFLWEADAPPGTTNIQTRLVFAMQSEWLKQIWLISTPGHSLSGPAEVLRPIALSTTITKCQWKGRTLDSLPQYEEILIAEYKAIIWQCERGATSRMEDVNSLLLQSIIALCDCFGSSFPDNWQADVKELAFQKTPLNLSRLVNLLATTTNNHLAQALSTFLCPAISEINNSSNDAEYASAIANAFIALSHALLFLYVPDTPVDPAAAQSCRRNILHDQMCRIQALITYHKEWEKRLTGGENSPILSHLYQRLQNLQEDISHIRTPAVTRTGDVPRLHALFAELSQFLDQVLPQPKIDTILSELGSQIGREKEHMVQSSIAAFLQRLESAYPDYNDITHPFVLALLYLQFGLRLLTQIAVANNVPKLPQDLAGSLVATPAVIGISMLNSMHSAGLINLASSEIPPAQLLLLRLSSFAYEGSIGIHHSIHMKQIGQEYDQLLRLYLLDRAKEAREEREANSLYRSNKIDQDILDDTEQEEREFLELFPQFGDILEPEAQTTIHPKGPQSLSHIQPTHIHDLCHIHFALMESTPSNLAHGAVFQFIRIAILGSLLSSGSVVRETLDSTSIAFRLTLVQCRLRSLHNLGTAGPKPYNFYVDPNIPEVFRAVKLLSALRDRLSVLVQEFPDQMVLQHIQTRCDAVLSLDLTSSLGKILSALEQLLPLTDSWETFANRDNSLKSHQHAIAALIVAWRRLELTCWSQLLESHIVDFSAGAFDWWFRLYESCVAGTLAAADDETNPGSLAIDTHLTQLVPLLDKFVTSSPLGQFSSRIRLLGSFVTYLSRIQAQKRNTRFSHALSRAHSILVTLTAYYQQYESIIASVLTEKRVPVEKEIRDLIRLASWKDVNIHALKQSAQKSHRQLHKSIRKFREILRQPVAPLLSVQPTGDIEPLLLSVEPEPAHDSPCLLDMPSIPLPVLSSTPSHLIDLAKTLRRFQGLIDNNIHLFIASSSSHTESLACDIIETIHTLSNETATATDESLKNNLQARKRRAWADLLKELRRVGLTPNIKPQVLERQRTRVWLLELPKPRRDSIDDPRLASLLGKAESYFLRLLSMLPLLRDSLRSHNDEIPTRDMQRAAAFVESSFSYALNSQSLLAKCLPQYVVLEKALKRFSMICSTVSSSDIIDIGSHVQENLTTIITMTCRLVDALEEVLKFASEYPGPATDASPFASSVLDKIHSRLTELKAAYRNIRILQDMASLTGTPLLLRAEHETLLAALNQLHVTKQTLQDCATTEPRITSLIQPILGLPEIEMTADLNKKDSSTPTSRQASDRLLDALLVIIQGVNGKSYEQGSNSHNLSSDNHIRRDHALMEDIDHILNIQVVINQLQVLVGQLAPYPDELSSRLIEHVTPFLDKYLHLVREWLLEYSRLNKATFKITHVLCSTIQVLATKGFCKPQDMQGSQGGKEATEPSDGTGLGSGTGRDNISNEIEDEAQVEGLQGDETEPRPKGDGSEEQNAIEMSNDFAGDMEDISETGDGDDGDDDEDESQPEPEDKIENLDPLDPDAVDEKLWGNERGPEDRPDGGHTNEDRSKQQSGEAEVVAKEKQQKQPQRKEGEKQNEDGATEDGVDEEPEVAEGSDAQDTQEPNSAGAPIDEYTQDADTLELPDDLNFESQDQDVVNESSDAMEEDPLEQSEERADTMEPDADITDGDSLKTELDVQNQDPNQQDFDESMDDTKDDENFVAKPDLGDGAEGSEGSEGLAQAGQEGAHDTITDAAISNGGGGKKYSADNAPDRQQTDETNVQHEDDEAFSEHNATGGDATGGELAHPSGLNKPTSLQEEPIPNPLRSLGDALKEIQKRFHEIAESSAGDRPAPPPCKAADTVGPSQLEYTQQGDEDYDMQALGPAGEEQITKLRDLTITDGGDTGQDAPPPINFEESSPVDEPFAPEKRMSTNDGAGVEHALNQTQIHDLFKPDSERVFQEADPASSILKSTYSDEDQDVEIQLRQWQSNGQPEENAPHIWQLYSTLTQDLAYILCEQLRLILEPTLATRLKGDYRTGKRLNMKKIIPYIASEFTKDKIWLRRTKPSQRDYQVLIALDDSKSMAESHSVHLAYEALALVSKALNRLEAGDIAIARFGETIDLLHGFDSGPFTDETGARVMSTFRFRQNATNVLALIETSLQVLGAAREKRPSSSGDLWQLQIIISDGICQSHDQLRSLLRRAEEQRVMIVFVVVDALHQATGTQPGTDVAQNSILSMNQVAYKSVNGQMVLSMERYLDTFPFEYYVVLRNVEALPEVLSGTLRQFFERIAEK